MVNSTIKGKLITKEENPKNLSLEYLWINVCISGDRTAVNEFMEHVFAKYNEVVEM